MTRLGIPSACRPPRPASAKGTAALSRPEQVGIHVEVETPHLRASEWAEASPDSTRRRRPLSQKLFASDDLRQGAGPGESQSAVKLLSAMKELQQQQQGLPLEDQRAR